MIDTNQDSTFRDRGGLRIGKAFDKVNQVNIFRIVSREFLVSFFIGSVPFLYMYSKQDLEKIEFFIKGAVPPESVLYYMFTVFLVASLFMGAEYFSLIYDDTKKKIISGIVDVVKEVGDTFISFLRFVAGVFAAFVVLWIGVEPETSFNLTHLGLIFFALEMYILLFSYALFREVRNVWFGR